MSRLTNLRPRVGAANLSRSPVPPKTADAHYLTPEHRAWARVVVTAAAGQCQGKGCTRTGVRLFADHIVELKDGGSPFSLANGRALCGSCHTAKTNAARQARWGKSTPPAN